MELDDRYDSKTTKEESFPSPKEVPDFHKMVKQVDGTYKYYIMVDGQWYYITDLTRV